MCYNNCPMSELNNFRFISVVAIDQTTTPQTITEVEQPRPLPASEAKEAPPVIVVGASIVALGAAVAMARLKKSERFHNIFYGHYSAKEPHA